ncbi:hypothetical protein PGO54_15010 [Klebsiella aerogenes]
MEIIIVSDNQFYLHAFTNINCSMMITPDLAFDINYSVYDSAIVIISVSNNHTMLNILEGIIKKNTITVFIEPTQWSKRIKLTNIYNIYILPSKMHLHFLMETIRKSISSQCDCVRIRPEKIQGSEWSTMLHLMSGISNRNLAPMLKSSEKTISGRLISLSMKTGLSKLNKAKQLNAIYLYYLIYILSKPAEEKIYYRKQCKDILEFVRK